KRSRDDDDEAPVRTGLSYPANRDGWVRMIKDLGMQFNFVSADQMEKAELTPSKYKVMILPFSSALSDEEVRDLAAFAQAGGVVIADGAAGIMDQHCAWQQGATINDFFGITAPLSSNRAAIKPFSANVSITAEGARWGMAAKDLTGISAAEPNIKATTGTPLIRIGNADGVIVRRVGKGWAVYLNTFLHDYAKQRAEKFGGENYRSLVGALLAHVGVEPTERVLGADGKRLPQAQVVRYRFGGAQILTIVKDNVALEGIAQRDGVTTYNDAALGQIARQDISIKLPGKFYVTDIRSGQRLGYTDSVRSSVIIGDALVLGLSPDDNKINIGGPTSASFGEHVKFKLDSSVRGPRLIRCQVFDPNGAILPVYAGNLLVQTTAATFVLPFALNDAAGVYTVTATDVITGASARAKITLK
ncbi:MAG TPA: beta-galactosidase trimerization domain-containing protein, partial [Pyrinomonadaceae bacterium]